MLRGPAGSLAEAAIGGEGELFGRRELEAASHAFSDIFGCLDIRTFDIDNADGDVVALADFANDFNFSKFAAGHLDMDFVEGEIQESREHRAVMTRADRARFIVAEAEVG